MATTPPNTSSQYPQGAYNAQAEADRSGPSEPSIAQLLSGLLGDAQGLIHKEFALARQEIGDSLSVARQSAIALGIGAGITAAGALLLLFALSHGIAAGLNLPLWLAYLIVGGALCIIGALALSSGINRLKQVNALPTESIDSIKEDIQWLKEQTPSDRT